jgi:hypothetical protein
MRSKSVIMWRTPGEREVFMNKKKKTNNILPFPGATRPKATPDPPPSTAFFQIGSDRFAIHMWYESLPPAPLRLVSPATTATENPLAPSVARGSRGSGARQKRPSLVFLK